MQPEDQLALLAGPGGVDAAWYRTRYADVAMLGMDPALHYLRYGAPMGRRPNPGFDTRFYAASHADVAPADPMGGVTPLVHYLTQGAADGRPASPEALRAALDAVAARAAAEWPLPPAVQGRPDPVISYCIPVMNRPDDIKGTLAFNLAQARGMEGAVEFILLFYDRDQDTHDWVRAQFGPELASGLLRLELSDALDTWHFGRAKNGFRGLMRGQVYSSLDGDNFVTRGETEQLLGVWRDFGDHFVFHHFSGNWGDGTSGRVSLPAAIYRTIGYSDRFLPRQYDEIDLILSALRHWPAMPFLCHDAERNSLTLSKRTRDFREAARLGNRIVQMPQPPRHAPLNPKGEGYAAEDPLLKAMSEFNQFTCYMTNARDEGHRAAMLAEVVAARHRVIDAMDPGRILPVLFDTAGQPEPLPPAEPGTVSLFACVKNDDAFLPALVAHYRARGVGRFLIVDDGSDRPVRDLLPDADVRVFRPKVGSFLTAKGLWLEGLMKAHLPEGGWALVVDADEFIDLPARACGRPGRAATGRAGFRTPVRPCLPHARPGGAGLQQPQGGGLGLWPPCRPGLGGGCALSRLRHGGQPAQAAADPLAAGAAPEPGVPHAALHRRHQGPRPRDLGGPRNPAGAPLQAGQAVFRRRARGGAETGRRLFRPHRRQHPPDLRRGRHRRPPAGLAARAHRPQGFRPARLCRRGGAMNPFQPAASGLSAGRARVIRPGPSSS